jgi:cytochrome c-type biogenesis protein CcmF
MKSAGASITHVGFALFLVGVLISSSKKKVLSENTTGIAVFEKTKDQDPAENITLFKGVRTDMGKYFVTYVRDTANDFDRKKYFEIKFESKDGRDNFYLYPDVLKNNKGMEGFAANPDKQHYLWGDILAMLPPGWALRQHRTHHNSEQLRYKKGTLLFIPTACSY